MLCHDGGVIFQYQTILSNLYNSSISIRIHFPSHIRICVPMYSSNNNINHRNYRIGIEITIFKSYIQCQCEFFLKKKFFSLIFINTLNNDNNNSNHNQRKSKSNALLSPIENRNIFALLQKHSRRLKILKIPLRINNKLK